MNSSEIKFKPNAADLAAIDRALGVYQVAVQDAIIRKALRRLQNDIIESSRAATPSETGASRKSLARKVKVFGTTIWAAIGYKVGFGDFQGTGRARRRSYDQLGAGWRTHFTELGYHSWPKGRSSSTAVAEAEADRKARKLRGEPSFGARGRGWKRGLRHRGAGTYHRGTKATLVAAARHNPSLLPYLNQVLHEVSLKASPTSATVGRL